MAIVLASSSAARQLLLRNAGVVFSVVPPTVDEAALKALHPQRAADALAQNLAIAKCLSVSTRSRNDLVISADQILESDGRRYDKPCTETEARAQLAQLRDQPHMLWSSVCCARSGTVLWQHTAQATMTMRAFSDEFLDRYLATVGAEALTSVAAYKLEGPGLQLFEKIDGDYFTILGLPLLPLLAYLRSAGELDS